MYRVLYDQTVTNGVDGPGAGCGETGAFRLGSRNFFVAFHVVAGVCMLLTPAISPRTTKGGTGGGGGGGEEEPRRTFVFGGDEATNMRIFAACLALEAGCFGGANAVSPGLARQLFSPRNSQTVYAMMLTATAAGGLLFPNLAAACWDTTAGPRSLFTRRSHGVLVH